MGPMYSVLKYIFEVLMEIMGYVLILVLMLNVLRLSTSEYFLKYDLI